MAPPRASSCKHSEDPNIISGTFKYSDAQTTSTPAGIKHIYLKPKIKLIHKAIKESDIVLIDLNTTPVFEADQIINQLKDNFNVNTTIIILSNLMTWFNTKEKKDKGDDGEKEKDKDKENKNEDQKTDEDKSEDVNTIL